MIQFNRVNKYFKDQQVFNAVSLFLPKSSYTFICGPKKSGKTTLLKMIMAYEKPDSGQLMVDDMDICSLPHERVPFLRRQIGLIETLPLMLENCTVSENIAVSMQVAGFDGRAVQERVASSLAQSGLEVIADVPVQRLDEDQRRLVACARATIHRPRILLADEPATELRDSTAITQHELLQNAHAHGATVVVTGSSGDSRVVNVSGQPARANAFRIDEGKIYPYESAEHMPRS